MSILLSKTFRVSEKLGFFGRFTYTTTIAYAYGREEKNIREKATVYLDEVILRVCVGDHDQVYAIVVVSQLLPCLRVCPGQL
jgi:hypothetical protein